MNGRAVMPPMHPAARSTPVAHPPSSDRYPPTPTDPLGGTMTTTTTTEIDIRQMLQERFAENIATHELAIIRDEGVYRHLRCSRPDTWAFGFDVVTWPGHLAITGDMGAFVFARTHDMFEFFGPLREGRGINTGYWSEKLVAPQGQRSVRKWSDDAFREDVVEWRDLASEELDDDERRAFHAEVDDEILDRIENEWSRDRKMQSLLDFDWTSPSGHRIVGHHEWENDPTVYDYSFMWCCWAITWAIREYRAAEAARAPRRRWWRFGR